MLDLDPPAKEKLGDEKKQKWRELTRIIPEHNARLVAATRARSIWPIN